MTGHGFFIHMIDNTYIMKTKMINIFFHCLSVTLIIFYCEHAAFAGDDRSFDRNALAADNTYIILQPYMHFIQDNCTDLTAYIMNGSTHEIVIPHTNLICISRIRINDQHARRCIDSTIDHIAQLIVLHLSYRFGTFIIPDLTFSQTCIPHPIKNIRLSCLCKYKYCPMTLHHRNQVFIFSRNIQHLHFFQIDLRILSKILKPGKNNLIGKNLLFHFLKPPITCLQKNNSYFLYKNNYNI